MHSLHQQKGVTAIPSPCSPSAVVGDVTVDGAAAAGVEVTASPGGRTTTGANGGYSIEVPAGSIIVSVGQYPGADFPTSPRTVTVVDGDTVRLDFIGEPVAAPTGTVTGQVSIDGQPGAGVSISTPGGAHTATAADGGYSLVVPAGEVALTAGPHPGVDFEDNPRAVSVAANTTVEVDFSGVTQTAASITAQVIVDDEPRANVGVEITGPESRSSTTDENGTAVFRDLESGTYSITVADPAVAWQQDSRSVSLTAENPHGAVSFSGTRFEERILFATEVGGNSEIYSMAPDGSDPRPLIQDAARDNSPRISPDGTRVAFHRDHLDGDHEVWIMELSGQDFQRLPTSGASYNPAFAAVRMAYSARDANRDIYTVRLDGSDERRLTRDPATDAAPAWSPAADRIVFQSERTGSVELYLIDPDGTGLTPLTSGGGRKVNPRWSPDGLWIAYAAELEPEGPMEIYTVRRDGSGPRQITSQGLRARSPSWSPDMEFIVFQARPLQGGNWEIYVVEVETGTVTRLTDNTVEDEDPEWGRLLRVPRP